MLFFSPTTFRLDRLTAAHHTHARAGSVSPSVWGLSALRLHDAHWNGCGVQCLRQGDSTVADIDRTADLYLLLESDQCILFDLASIIDRLVWHGAAVTRIKVVEPKSLSYDERIVCDEHGLVRRIERYYPDAWGRRSEMSGVPQARRAFITDRTSLAARWLGASSPREGWVNLRRALGGRARVDRIRIAGKAFRLQSHDDEKRLLDALAEHWPEPDRVIEGIEQIAPGVWKLARDAECDPAGLIGPVWLGCGRIVPASHGKKAGNPPTNGFHSINPSSERPLSTTRGSAQCIVGPAWLGDDADALAAAVRLDGRAPAQVREMIDVELAPRHRRARHRRSASMYPLAKRTLDVTLSAIGLIVAAPLMALIATAVLIDNGRPVFFRHKRQTLGGRVFNCLKFRTMRRDAERIVADLKRLNLCDGPQVNIQNDPRVTRVGRVLRAMHLDELPQLWNVLRGEMSLVGPRPSPDNENQYCPAWREARLSVRPGITGLWQLRRTRSPGQDFQEWIRYDIEYVRKAGFWYDVSILFETAKVLSGMSNRRHGNEERTQ